MIIDITQLQQLDKFSSSFAQSLRPGDVIYLKGDLGAGKTTFTQLLLKNLLYKGKVKSPTYAIYEQYNLDKLNVIHMDLYRIGDPQELYYLAIDEIFDGNNVVLIEWPEKGAGVIPSANKTLGFELVNADNRALILDTT